MRTLMCALLLWVGPGIDLAAAASMEMSGHSAHAGGALGSSAAIDNEGRLWVAYTETHGASARILLTRSEDSGRTWTAREAVPGVSEPVAADGENRPKLAFGAQRQMYLSWTSPTSERYTGDIRFTRSQDGGSTWSVPITINKDRQVISHRFESLLVDGAGRVWLAWLDKRDVATAERAGKSYAGAATYYAYSEDEGATWHGDLKLADHSCECCRIAMARDGRGRPAVLWRHVFEPDERDHAFAVLGTFDPNSPAPTMSRVTFDRWRVEACPHQGPGLAITAAGTRHAVWFNVVADQGRVFYGQLGDQGPVHVRELPAGATHADVASIGSSVVVAWKRFDGAVSRAETWQSSDGGKTFTTGPQLDTAGDSDQPRLVAGRNEIWLVWRRAQDIAALPVASVRRNAAAHAATPIQPFGRATLHAIEQRYRGKPFVLVLWDLDCPYCVKSLTNLAAAQRKGSTLPIVTVATDSVNAASALQPRLTALGVRGDAYAFAADAPEALQYAIDPSWTGEKPRAYFYSADGRRRAVTGVITSGE